MIEETKDKFFVVSGLPRAGSSLIMNLLGQNPAHHVTPTSGLIELFIQNINAWPNYIEFRAEGLEKALPRVRNSLGRQIYGFFEPEFKDDKVVFDKSRGWLQYAENLENCLGHQVKIIVPIRDVREIAASFEKLYRKRDIDWRYPVGDAYFKVQTTVDRCEMLLAPGGVVGISIQRVRDAMARISDRLIIIPYASFCANPTGTMEILHQTLGLPEFTYNPTDIKQITHEDDTWHGMDLHVIRPDVTPAEPEPWKEILPAKYVEALGQRYEDINKLCVPPKPQKVVPPPKSEAVVIGESND